MAHYLSNKVFTTQVVTYQTVKQQRAKLRLQAEDIRQTHERRQQVHNDNKHLVKLQELEQALRQAERDFKQAEDDVAASLYLIATNAVASWRNISQEDAVQEAVMMCIAKIGRFNPSNGKAFNYFTTCILNCYKQQARTTRNYDKLTADFADCLRTTGQTKRPAARDSLSHRRKSRAKSKPNIQGVEALGNAGPKMLVFPA